MESPSFVSMAGRVKRKRDKDEALTRKTEWITSRRGRVMTCSSCGVAGHKARGCEKLKSGEETSKSGQLKGRKQSKGKQPMKRKTTLIDEDTRDERPPNSSTLQ